MMSSNILFSQIYDEKHIRISYKNESISRSPEASNYIKKQWEDSIKQNASMFSGDLVSVKKNNSNSEYIDIDTFHTTFDDFFVSKRNEFRTRFPKEIQTTVLSVGCVIITSDNYLVLGTRANHLAFESGKVTVVSGLADNRDIVQNKQIDIFGCIRREMQEEIGIKEDEIQLLSCIGLIGNFKHHNVYVPFFGCVNVSFSQIIERKNDGEILKNIKIKNSKSAIQEKLQNNNLSDITKPTLEIYLNLFNECNKK